MKLETRAIIFDFDGVILESAGIKTRAFRMLFQDSPKVEEIVRYHLEFVGHGRHEKFRHIYEHILRLPYTPTIEKQLCDRFAEQVWRQVLTVPAVPGALEYLQSSPHRHYVASGTPEAELREIVVKRELGRYFLELHGSPRLKPDIINDLLLRNRLAPHEVVFIGDGKSDRLAAEKCGIPFIARITPETGADLADCEWQCEDLTPLARILSRMQGRQT